MKDKYQRDITYMRISLTDRCNYCCNYCRDEDVKHVSHHDILTYEEILEIVKEAVMLGIDTFKVTGGEPFLRKDAMYFLEQLKQQQGVREVTLTTNGSLLDEGMLVRLKEIGIDGINISLDTLDEIHYKKITKSDAFGKVLQTIKCASSIGLHVKINAVLLDEIRDEEILNLVEYTKNRRIALRFIEVMPRKEILIGHRNRKQVLKLLEKHGFIVNPVKASLGNGPAVYYQLGGFQGYVGFIEPIHGKFCSKCNRVRLSATGYLKLCLFHEDGCDLRQVVRENPKELRNAMEHAILKKPKAHDFEHGSLAFTMNQIGG